MPPGRHFAILTCMDARLDPAKYAGLAEVTPTSSARRWRASDDAIRSLVISYKLLGTQEWFVIHHTDCGMQTFTDEVMRICCVAASRPPASTPADGTMRRRRRLHEGEHISWLTIAIWSKAC